MNNVRYDEFIPTTPTQHVSTSQSPVSNAAAVTVGLALASGLAVIVNLVVIAGYGAQAHGQVTLLLATAYLGTLLCDLGLASKAGVRRIARIRRCNPHRLGMIVGDHLAILFTVALIGYILVAFSSPLLSSMLEIPAEALPVAGLWLFAGAGVRACFMVFIGFERMAYLLVLSPAAELARLAWAGICMGAGLDLDWLYLGWSATWAGSLLVCIGLVLRLLGKHEITLDRSWTRQKIRRLSHIVRHSLAYHVPLLTNQALGPVLLLITGLTLDWFGRSLPEAAANGQAQVSALQICFMLALIVRLVSQGLATSMFPVYVRGSLERSDQHRGENAVRVLSAAVLLCFGGYVALGRWGLGLVDLFNPAVESHEAGLYAQAWPTLLVLTAALGIDSFRVQIDQLLMSDRHVGVVVRGELVKIVLLGGLLPVGTWLGFRWVGGRADLGAGLGLLITLTIIALARAWSTRNVLGHVPHASAWRGVVGLVLLSAMALLTRMSIVPPGVTVVLALPISLLLIVGLGLIRAEDWRRVMHMVRMRDS